jgi:kinesin family protein C2/C3
MEIELLTKGKVKSPNLSFDRNGAGLTKNTVNQPSQLLSDERMLKFSDRVVSDPQSYAEENGDSTDIANMGLGEAEFEDNGYDGLPAGETDNCNPDKTVEMTAERL